MSKILHSFNRLFQAPLIFFLLGVVANAHALENSCFTRLLAHQFESRPVVGANLAVIDIGSNTVKYAELLPGMSPSLKLYPELNFSSAIR